MNARHAPAPQPRVVALQDRLRRAIGGPDAGRITQPKANRISKDVRGELGVVEAAMRTARLSGRVGSA